jgi:probable H4MPT-linked C1 transfer pathway protein
MLAETDVVGIDVGGANLKAADGLGRAASEPFELWRHPEDLPAAVQRLLAPARAARIMATMTGEIADCFSGRVEGVRRIVAALEQVASALPEHPDLRIYAVDGRFLSPEESLRQPLAVAASNWHAAARLAASVVPSGRWLLVDVGSTTTDVVPIRDGVVRPLARDDVGRMATGELVYSGVERTPVAALVRSLPWHGVRRPVATETFATARDVWLVLGGLAEDPDSFTTADGRAATRPAARARLARMLLVDPEAFPDPAAYAAAEWAAEGQARLLAGRIRHLLRGLGWQPDGIVHSGHGRCLADRALERLGLSPVQVDLSERLGPDVSRACPAHAIAAIARGTIP